MYNDVIGIVGGMGSYATLSFFERLLDAFPGEKEWDRPRIIIDNRCTMPSRVRAILYREQEEELAEQLADSVKHLLEAGATKIVLACNTSHFFLPEIYKKVPEAEGKILNIIDATAEKVAAIKGLKKVSLLASEGTIDTHIFDRALSDKGVEVITPTGEEYELQRVIIESVKQRRITTEEIQYLIRLICSAHGDAVIIGCTEFPVVFKEISKKALEDKIVIDPLECVIEILLEEIK